MSAATASTVTVNVTQEHIDHGTARQCDTCPVALALVAAISGALYVEVMSPDLGYAIVSGPDCGVGSVMLPAEALEFIARFDDGMSVEPFTFTAEIDR